MSSAQPSGQKKPDPLTAPQNKRLCMSLESWYPQLSLVAKTPRTLVYQTDVELSSILDGKTPPGWSAFIKHLTALCDQIGYPCFLRTGHTSAKHSWSESCFVTSAAVVHSRVREIVEYSCLCDIIGLPTNVWAVRELLETQPIFTAFYGRMPITKERRYFIQDGRVVCHHGYWPAVAIQNHNPSERQWNYRLGKMNHESLEEISELTERSIAVSRSFAGAWSLDWLWAKSKDDSEFDWYAIDMAWAERSFHWPGCPLEHHFNPRKETK